jgi:hypothetical protein
MVLSGTPVREVALCIGTGVGNAGIGAAEGSVGHVAVRHQEKDVANSNRRTRASADPARPLPVLASP